MRCIGARRQLPLNSPLRGRLCGSYQFFDQERRPPAALRTTRLMRYSLRIMQEENLMHVCGFAGLPMFSNRLGFDWVLDNIPDPMHLLGRMFIFFGTITCGGHGKSKRAQAWRDKQKDKRHREECEQLDIFPSVWPSFMHKLTDDVRAALMTPTDEDIAGAPRAFLVRWLDMVDESSNGLLVEAVRQRVMEVREQLRQPADYMYAPRTPTPLPWRLTRDGFDTVDRRIVSMVFPANTERVVKDGKSFLRAPAAICKTAKKIMMLLYIYPTVLRGYVSALRRALRFVVLGLRMLQGQVHSFNECTRLQIEPGSRCFNPADISVIRKLIVEGLSMVTGSVPPSAIIPCLHVLEHYADQAELFAALLRWSVLSHTPTTPQSVINFISYIINQVFDVCFRNFQSIHQDHVF